MQECSFREGDVIMRKKRKGSELLFPDQGEETVESRASSRASLSNLKSHYSLEDYTRLKKRCKEDVAGNDNDAGSCKKRLVGVAATAPPCGSSSLVLPGRGLKRKIGCIGVATQMGRKNKIEDDYVKGETLGKGKFGSVWLCRSRATGVEYACKTLQKGEETVHREVEIMQHLSGHPGVVTLEAVYEDSECFHLVMELCSGGRLIDQMAKEGLCSEHRAASIFKELMLVIKYCHEMGVVHRDVKPENILLTKSGKIKLADFGLAMRVANGQLLTGLVGSPGYVAPEVLTGNYSEKVDIWSAGVLLYALLTGALPFKGDSLESVFESIKTVKLDFHSGIWESVSKPARNLIERILTRDFTSRMTADEVLGHPWILFYTERTLKMLSIKSKSKNHPVPPPSSELLLLLPTGNKLEQDDSGSVNGSPGAINKSQTSSPGYLGYEEEEEDECGLVDALAVAVSNVRISGPKRSRICVVPTSPIREQCSSNVTSNNLCKAF